MDEFRFLDHPSDLIIVAYGKNLEELFKNSAFAMMTFVYPKNINIKHQEAKAKIELKAKSPKELLPDFLSKILDLSDDKEVCYNEFYFKKITDNELMATIYGFRTRNKEKIKSIKNNLLEIKKTNHGWEAKIIFDI